MRLAPTRAAACRPVPPGPPPRAAGARRRRPGAREAAHDHHGLRRPREAPHLAAAPAPSVHAALAHQRLVPDGHLPAVDHGTRCRGREAPRSPLRLAERETPLPCRAHDRRARADARTRCSADAASASSSSVGRAARPTTSVTSGRPTVIVPVLSSTTVVICPARSRISPPRIRMPFSAPLPVPDEDRGRRGEAHRARAGDDHHRHEAHERRREAGAGRQQVEPDDERGDGEADHGGREVARDDVRQPRDRRAAGLRLLHQPDDLLQRRVAAHPRRAEREAPGGVHAPAEDRRAGQPCPPAAIRPSASTRPRPRRRRASRRPPGCARRAGRRRRGRHARPPTGISDLDGRSPARGPCAAGGRSSRRMASDVRPRARASSSRPSRTSAMIAARHLEIDGERRSVAPWWPPPAARGEPGPARA